MPAVPITIFRLEHPGPLQNARSRSADPIRQLTTAQVGLDCILVGPVDSGDTPDWLVKAGAAFQNVPQTTSKNVRGLILLRKSGIAFAIPFGQGGRALLDESLIRRGWGRRAALNLLYDSTGAVLHGGTVLRKERKTVLGRGLNTQVQASRAMTLDELGFDSTTEMLKSVTISADRPNWGSSVEGSDGFKLRWNGAFKDLHQLCWDVERLNRRTHYRKHFDFIDALSEVRDATTKTNVLNAFAAAIRAGHTADLGLNPAEHIDLVGADIGLYGLPGQTPPGGRLLADLTIDAYRAELQTAGALTTLSATELKKHRLRLLLDGDVEVKAKLSALLEGTVQVGTIQYVLSEGRIYELSQAYLNALDTFINGIADGATARLNLPKFSAVPTRLGSITKGGVTTQGQVRDERAYNIEAALPNDRLMLDARNVVTVPKRTEKVEVCDILTSGSEFIHVKRGTRSSDLSHLFSQALVSAELLLDSPDFRTQSTVAVSAAAAADGKVAGSFAPTFTANRANGATVPITLGIIDKKWDNGAGGLRKAADVLPFFSKINLRIVVRTLKRRSFTVELARIEV